MTNKSFSNWENFYILRIFRMKQKKYRHNVIEHSFSERSYFYFLNLRINLNGNHTERISEHVYY